MFQSLLSTFYLILTSSVKGKGLSRLLSQERKQRLKKSWILCSNTHGWFVAAWDLEISLDFKALTILNAKGSLSLLNQKLRHNWVRDKTFETGSISEYPRYTVAKIDNGIP